MIEPVEIEDVLVNVVWLPRHAAFVVNAATGNGLIEIVFIIDCEQPFRLIATTDYGGSRSG